MARELADIAGQLASLKGEVNTWLRDPNYDTLKHRLENLEKLRLERFWSRAELAEKSGINRDHIGRLERGEGGSSRPPTVRHLAEALGVDPHELLLKE